MALFEMKSGRIICDSCSRVISRLEAPKELFKQWVDYPIEVVCVECLGKENKEE